jgi:hypothetical protein
MGAHATKDHLLISSLVGVAIANAAADEAEAELGSGLLTGGAKESIAAGFKPLTGNDPFAVKAAIRSEQKVFTGWIMERYRGADAGKRAAAELLGMMEGGGPSDAGKAIAPMNEQQLHAALELVNPYYELALAAWDAPDASERLKKLGERVEAGEFGPMAKILAPSLARARENDRKASERVATVVKRLASE